MKFNNQFTNPLLGGHEICYSEIIELKIFRNELNQLAFTDDRTGLVNEAFVQGADLIMETFAKILGTDNFTLKMQGFALPICDITWNEKPKNAIEIKLTETLKNDIVGDSYYYNWEKLNKQVWLCPNLHRYYNFAPNVIWFFI